jgi:hypothetical protein
MIIKNIAGLTTDDINRELAHGARFVVYPFTISIIIMTFKRYSDIYFIRTGENGAIKSFPYTLLTFLLGWWGIPWGPMYSIECLSYNLKGGKDITNEILSATKALR